MARWNVMTATLTKRLVSRLTQNNRIVLDQQALSADYFNEANSKVFMTYSKKHYRLILYANT